MNKKTWRMLHWVSIYFLWFAITLTYYFELAGGHDVQIVDYVYFFIGVAVYLLRLGAWLSEKNAQLVKQ